MNALIQYDQSVPAFLRNANFLALNQKAAAGLSSGAPPRLSFRGSRFRFISGDGTETPLPADGQPGNNSVSVDVVVLDAGDAVSKFYYDRPYDPNADDQSPACFSDNGVGPSIRAARPQALLCQSCAHNAWGSKITPQGTKVKACSDVKKLAILPVSNVDGPAFLLGIPAASLKTWTATVNAVSQRGIPIPALVIRIGFDPDPAYPKLTFSPVGYINEQQAQVVQDLLGSAECAELVGRNDTPITALPGTAPAPVAQTAPVAAPQPVHIPQTPPLFPQPPGSGTAQRQQDVAPSDVVMPPPPRRRRPPVNPGTALDAPAQATPFTPPAAAAPAAGAQDLNALLDKVMAGK